VEWGVISRVPCSIKLLKAPKNEASFHDFDEFERLVEVARSEALALLVVLLGGEAGLRCGEMTRCSQRRFSKRRSPAIKASFARVQRFQLPLALPRLSARGVIL
jgi:hypothetical protein